MKKNIKMKIAVMVFGVLLGSYSFIASAQLKPAPTLEDLISAQNSGQLTNEDFKAWNGMQFDPANPGKIIGCDTRLITGDPCTPINPSTVPLSSPIIVSNDEEIPNPEALLQNGTAPLPNRAGTSSADKTKNYYIMEAIPGFFESGSSISFPDLLSAIYRFGIWTVGIAALFMITIGGFMYATSAGNTSAAGTAKGIISDALLGLVVALTAYLALYIVNPDLVTTDALRQGAVLEGPTFNVLNLPANTETAAIITGTGIQDSAKKILANTNISWDSNPDCADAAGVKVSPKRNMEELSRGEPMTVCNSSCKVSVPCTGKLIPNKKMLEAMLAVAQTKKYTVTSIAGGAHSRTSDHYKPKAIDIIPNPLDGDWNSYVAAFKSNGSHSDQTFCEDPGNPASKIKSLNCKVKHHIHVSFVNW